MAPVPAVTVLDVDDDATGADPDRADGDEPARPRRERGGRSWPDHGRPGRDRHGGRRAQDAARSATPGRRPRCRRPGRGSATPAPRPRRPRRAPAMVRTTPRPATDRATGAPAHPASGVAVAGRGARPRPAAVTPSGSSGGGNASEVVTSALSADDGFDARRSRRRDVGASARPHPQGSPHRSLPDGRARRRPGRDPDGGARGSGARRALRQPVAGRRDVDRRQHLPRQGPERAARGWRPRSSTSARRRTACSTAATSRSTTSEVEEAQPKIERLLKNGQAVLVQVTKNPIGAKGARLTQEVSLAGRFVVMVPNQPTTYGISKRLPDDERTPAPQGARRDPPGERGPHRADRGRGCDARGARARPRPAPGPVEADLQPRRAGQAGEAPLQGARARRAGHPGGVHEGVPLDRRSTTRRSTRT